MIKQEEVMIIPKTTKLEWDMHRFKMDEKEVIDFYEKEGLNAKKILESHERQKKGLEKLKKILPGALFIARDNISKEIAEKASLVISYGGDNHFLYVSHFLDDTPILGINSDSTRSEGALTSLTIDELNDAETITNKYFIEEWPRLQAEVNGKIIDTLGISDIFIGEKYRYQMSRLIINIHGKSVEQKGSGLLISTGAGSTGWYNSSSRYMFSKGDVFQKTAKEARFIFTEPYLGRLISPSDIKGSIKENEYLEVTSLCDSQAVFAIDSLKVINLAEGSKIKITLSNPLKVVRF